MSRLQANQSPFNYFVPNISAHFHYAPITLHYPLDKKHHHPDYAE